MSHLPRGNKTVNRSLRSFIKYLSTPQKNQTIPVILLTDELIFVDLEISHRNQSYRTDTEIVSKSGKQTPATTT